MAEVNLGFVGLGVMGAPMAGHLARAGHPLKVWNRTRSKAEAFVSSLASHPEGSGANAEIADSLKGLGRICEIVFLCVNRTEDVEECLAELSSEAHPGTLFVDHSTIAPAAARRIAEDLRGKGFGFVDAPITGGSMGAQKGQLTIFCGGEEDDIEAALPYMRAYAKRAERVGGSGAGQMMKMANQIAVGGSLLALCESLAFARKAGLDLAQTRELLSGGAAGSWAFDNYGPKILTEDWSPGFSVKNQRKDFRYCLEAASELGAYLPGTGIVDALLEILEEDGHGEWTTAALYKVLSESEVLD